MSGIQGTNVVAPIVPLDTADVHPTHEALYGKGGYRTVATTAERDAIPAARREEGMLVHVIADSTAYRLSANLTTWTVFNTGGGSSAWADITDKPSTFAPSTHAGSHAIGGSDALTISSVQVVGSTANFSILDQLAADISEGGLPYTYSIATGKFSPPTHTHGNLTNAGAIGTTANLPIITTTSGVLAAGSFGTGANTFCQGNDSRLSDSRAPSGAAGGDLTGSYPNPTIAAGAVVTADLADSAVTAAKIASAAVTVAKVSATGTASASTFLRGDGAWAAIAAANVSGLATSATTDTTNATNITTGTVAAARLAAHASTHSAGGSDAATLCQTFVFTRSSAGGSGASGSNGSYTWTIPSTAKVITLDCTSGGGGGGSGRRGAAGSVRGGGGGGGGGGRTVYEFPVSELSSLGLSIVVGAGGAGGAAVAANDTNGNAGASGGRSTVSVTSTGEWLSYTFEGTGGGGGSTSGGAGGAPVWVNQYVAANGGAGGTGAAGSASGFSVQAATAGGGGGGISSGDTAFAGGMSYLRAITRNLVNGNNGGAVGTAGGNGADVVGGGSGNGGGGGGASTTAAAGAGGNGSAYGGGGGGGGASVNGNASGAGGNGGDGVVRITVWY